MTPGTGEYLSPAWVGSLGPFARHKSLGHCSVCTVSCGNQGANVARAPFRAGHMSAFFCNQTVLPLVSASSSHQGGNVGP